MHPIRLQICQHAAELLVTRRVVNTAHARRTAIMQIYGRSAPPWLTPTLDEVESIVSDKLANIGDYPPTQGMSARDIITGLFSELEAHQFRGDSHPERDVDYHLLQTFDICIEAYPYDADLVFAGLVHDLGFPVAPKDPVTATLDHFSELLTPRTRLLLENLALSHAVLDHTAGHRARKRLMADPAHECMLFLAEADRSARQVGVETSSLEEALDIVDNLF